MVDRAVASIQSKIADFKNDSAAVQLALQESGLPTFQEAVAEIKKKTDIAIVDSEQIIKALETIRELMDDEEDVTPEILKTVKATTSAKASEFVAEQSKYKLAKFISEKHRKSALAHAKKSSKDKLAAPEIDIVDGTKNVTKLGLENMSSFPPQVVDGATDLDLGKAALLTSDDVFIVFHYGKQPNAKTYLRYVCVFVGFSWLETVMHSI
jgi:hypothetical protein